VHIGHRGCVARSLAPAYWFGHGLGYTSWDVESIEAPAESSGAGFSVVVRVRNTGARRGRQVVQVYASRESAVDRPARWLAGFAVVQADPGAAVDVPVAVSARALRHWDADRGAWAVEPGDVVLSAGRSAGELEASATVALREPA
jgi:beta-glucosidase